MSIANGQDSLYYSLLWTPKHAYSKAGVKQEGIFLYQFKNGVLKDSFLLQTKLYDSLGQVTRLDEYRGPRLKTRYHYFYSGSRLDSMVQAEVWLQATIIHRYAYDANGNLLLDQTFNRHRKTMQTRYVYNSFRQPIQIYTQIGDGAEWLSAEFKYRSDKLIQQIDYDFGKAEAADNFSYLYIYSNGTRTNTRYFRRASEEKRLIDCIRTYNQEGQLIEKINPPLPKSNWLPAGMHPRNEEEVETSVYLPNGMLLEVQTKRNNELVRIERRFYVY
ncbi:MAG TPA: hypothetical protein VER36_00015 [Flavisolibacter sp.]|nr:hypothetical protein [Flavisolibacter sp.]